MDDKQNQQTQMGPRTGDVIEDAQNFVAFINATESGQTILHELLNPMYRGLRPFMN